ncbi:MAG: FimV/HubP family polar landmark protein [Betaproteobacteria bacterium]
MNSNKHFWSRSGVSVAVATMLCLGAASANAVSLGKIRVQSALGQNLSAEIDIADLSDEDAKAVSPTLATPAAFAGMGLEYNAALNGMQVSMLLRPNGSRYIKLASSRPLNEPFVDLAIELSWASGRLVRPYRLLLDPPKNQEVVSPSPTIAAAPLAAPVVVSEKVDGIVKDPRAKVSSATPPVAVAITTGTDGTNAVSIAALPKSSSDSSQEPQKRQQIEITAGQTAGNLAKSLKPAGATVEQMLLAILNANPDAFIRGNVNLIRAGSIITIPDAAAVSNFSSSRARQMVAQQNQSFRSGSRVAGSAKSNTGTGDKSNATPAATGTKPADALVLSKGTVQEKAEKERMEQIARQRTKADAATQAAELARNIEELNQLTKAAQPSAVASGPAAAVQEPAKPEAPTTAGRAQGGVAAVPVVAPSAAVAPLDETLDKLLHSPGLLGAAAAVIAALGGLLWYRKRSAQGSVADAHTRAVSEWGTDSNFAFDTGEGRQAASVELPSAGSSTIAYPDTQLDLSNDLDPVAEAEVYLAYGKDLPAEEILKEGLRQTPNRVAIYIKLLGIYAKRGDSVGFEASANEVAKLVGTESTEWDQVKDLGRALDPGNPRYRAPAEPSPAANAPLDAPNFVQSMFTLEAAKSPELHEKGSASGNPKPSVTLPIFEHLGSTSGLVRNPHPADARAAHLPTEDAERLETTLALAVQFIGIGEKEGARALLDEVIASGDALLQTRAKSLLAELA